MTIEVVRIQDANGDEYDVPMDKVGSTYYPVYKTVYGDLSAAGNVVAADTPMPVQVGDSSTVDAFGRMRTAHPTTLFDSKLLTADKQPLLWDEALESGGGITSSTPTVAKPYLDISSTLNTAGVFTRQTFRRFNYQPGKSQLVTITGVLDLSGGGTGVERRIGLFDDNNGLFFEDDAGTIGVTVRTNDSGTPADTTVTQTNWNLDPMDGTGPSGITVDWSQSQIFVIDFQWLAVGRIRFGLSIGGMAYYVHETSSTNSAAIPTISIPNLPVRYQMVTTGSSPASSMRCICSAVISEGGADPSGPTLSHGTTDLVNANAIGTIYALLGIRLKSALVHCTVDPVRISAAALTADTFEWLLIMNPTVDGTFAFSDKANSCVQVATGSTANPSTNTVTGGTIIDRGYITGNGTGDAAPNNSLKLGVAIDGTQDELVLACRPLGVNLDIQGSLTWRELV